MPESCKPLRLTKVASPMGDMLLVTDDQALISLDYQGYEPRLRGLLAKRYGNFELTEVPSDSQGLTALENDLICRLRAYLNGDLTAIDPIPVNPGGTQFQNQVWQALRTIPPGTVRSYGNLAHQLGNPGAVRAVGATNSLNPISIVLPCHRVIGANGSLTGYAGGLDRKRWLLEHEGVELTQLKRHPKAFPAQQLSLLDIQ
ncbi:methylated-DNA--[protein]-cysteine S-methyltransferase [Leptothoe sp. PORK10 BA2]|uniref:methylated-DNA--[protein]-cysteine S-methyltransferase n=1 Tax=Leptothoe sp. PORK10 BA2 TaxID=3110254 RepID=UPI002B1F24CA|nr:methylated-DNA--[protein]-cysteine S-methyltransferase [Leptothoe sp. PORK10 BA2]MEA5466954.1 methylated-DNA--[protein]-cysteine S-methyltransferase [Leptothoe sp. PORK10 BA2]